MIKILFLAANPVNTPPLRLDEEARSIDLALHQAQFSDQFEISSHWAVRIDDLQELLLRHRPNIVHFAGHSGTASEIILQNEQGKAVTVPANALSNLFRLFKDTIKCVVLSACYSDAQAGSIAQHIDCVVGMADEFSDDAARSFATAFYRGLGYGRTIQEAFDLGCSQIELAGLDEQHKPKLLTNRIDAAQFIFAIDDTSGNDKLLSPEQLHKQLIIYRQRLLAETQYVRLEGIPLPDESLASAIPLQRIYINVQALEQRESQKLRRDEEQALLEAADGKQEKRERLDLFDLISRLGEYLYRRGESVESSQRPAPVDPLEAIRNHRHLVLLGAPGAGKSTLLRYLTHQMTKDEHSKIPVLVFLGAFALAYSQDRQLSLREWAIYNAAPDNNDLRRALRQAAGAGQVLWLFDGLDEAGDLREETSRQIGQIASRDQVVVTSRPLDYRRTHLESFSHFEALPLTTANVEQFITDWLTILAKQQGHIAEWVKDCSDWLQKQLADRPRIQTLTQNPLLLTFLVILARHDPRHDLPTRRSDLYRRYVEELFSAWEQRRHPEAIKLPKAIYLCGIETIAWYLHLSYFGRTHESTGVNNPVNSPDSDYLRRQLANVLRAEGSANQAADADKMASQILDFWLNTGLIEERQWQQWKLVTFRHLTFQEYGVANVLHRSWQQNTKRTWQFLKPRLHHFAWRESLLLLAEQMDTPAIDRLLGYLLRHPSPYDRTLQRDLYLTVTLAGESKQASSRMIQQIANRLAWYLKSHRWQLVLIWLLLYLLPIGIGFPIAWLAQMPMWIAVLTALLMLAAISMAIWRILAIRSLFLLPTRLWLSNARMNTLAVDALGNLGWVALDPPVVALNNGYSKFRRQLWSPPIGLFAAAALRTLGDREAFEPLVGALNDEDSGVRRRVVRKLEELGDRRAFEPLVGALNNDEDIYVRRNVVAVLRTLGDGRAFEPLVGALNNDEDIYVRSFAAGELGNLGDRRAVEPLIGALNNDEDSEVRKSAAEALRKLGDRRAVEPLIDALNDADSDVRTSAAESLAQLSKKHAKVKTIAFVLWWRLTDPVTKIDSTMFSSLNTVVNQFPIVAPADDLLLPSQNTPRQRLRWWLG